MYHENGGSKPPPCGLAENGFAHPTVGVGALDDPRAGNECFAFKILRQAPFANGEYDDNDQTRVREINLTPRPRVSF